MGSRFLACSELLSSNKALAVAASGTNTVRSELPDALGCPGLFPAPMKAQSMMRQYVGREAELEADAAPGGPRVHSAAFKASPDAGNVLWAGPAVDCVRTPDEPAADIIQGIALEACRMWHTQEAGKTSRQTAASLSRQNLLLSPPPHKENN